MQKASTHLALDDIRESIRELEHYKRHFFRATCEDKSGGLGRYLKSEQ
jgi:oligoribonuclease (3'-5' exoribonuclease)